MSNHLYCDETKQGIGGRVAAVTRLADDAAKLGAARLVLERDDPAVFTDKKIIRSRLLEAGCHDTLQYPHMYAREECLLSIPDAVAWSYAKGGAWRRLVEPLILEVVELQAPHSAKPGSPTVRKAAGLTSPS